MDDAEILVDWWTPLLVQLANTVGMGDLLAERPRTAEEIGAATGWQPQLAERVLRALALRGLFIRDDRRRWALGEHGGVLRSDHPTSIARFRFDGFEVGGWSRMDESLRSGQSSFELTFDTTFWRWLEEHPAVRADFDAKMRRRLPTLLAMVAEYDWPDEAHVVDVGGGTGRMLVEILGRSPGLSGALVDVAETIDAAKDVLSDAGVAERCVPVAGNFFESVPAGGDIYVLSQILHDWPDDDAVRILRTVATAMSDTGRVLLLEGVVPDEADGDYLSRLSLHMLAMFGSGERDRTQWADLLGRAGLRLQRIVPGPYVSWIEAVPA